MDDFRILIVDDEPYHRDLIKIRFEHEGLSVNCASSGMQCLRILQEKRFDLIITDFHMPEMGSMEMVRYIRLLDIKAPIIMLTGRDVSFKKILHDKDAQISMVLTKPINFRNLLNIVRAEKEKVYSLKRL